MTDPWRSLNTPKLSMFIIESLTERQDIAKEVGFTVYRQIKGIGLANLSRGNLSRGAVFRL